MTLTKEEIEMIEREAEKLFSDACEPVLLSEYLYGDVQKIVIGMLRRTATKYLLQLKAERERAGKLMEALKEIRDNQFGVSWVHQIARIAITKYEK